MSVMFLLSGIVGVGVGLSGYILPVVRNAEDILPDHETTEAADPQVAETAPA
jgi:hypothetical protein